MSQTVTAGRRPARLACPAPETVLARLGVSADGLSGAEAHQRLARHGTNELAAARPLILGDPPPGLYGVAQSHLTPGRPMRRCCSALARAPPPATPTRARCGLPRPQPGEARESRREISYRELARADRALGARAHRIGVGRGERIGTPAWARVRARRREARRRPPPLFSAWPAWITLGLTIGLAFNAWDVYFRHLITEADIRDEMDRLGHGARG
jgi:hypothetical protein